MDLPIFTAMMLADHQIISGQKSLERKLAELQSLCSSENSRSGAMYAVSAACSPC